MSEHLDDFLLVMFAAVGAQQVIQWWFESFVHWSWNMRGLYRQLIDGPDGRVGQNGNDAHTSTATSRRIHLE